MTDAPKSILGIRRAALEMAYDNGAINRERSEEDFLKRLEEWLSNSCATIDHSGLRTSFIISLNEIDAWLVGISDEAMLIICSGEEVDAKTALFKAPQGTDALLNAIFEEVL
jgi:hypothetical protein